MQLKLYFLFILATCAMLKKSSSQTLSQSNKHICAEYSGADLKSLTNDRGFSSSDSNGWELESIANSDGSQAMFWESCDAQSQGHESFLTTPLINKGKDIKNVHIKISFIVWCESQASDCNEDKLRGEVLLTGKQVSFDVQISQAHRGSVRSVRPPFPPYSAVIPVSLDVAAFRLRFSDAGLCIRISEIQVYSTFCPSEVRNLAYYPLTYAPRAPAEPVPVFGRCVMNSSPDPDVHQLQSTQHCASFGQWTDSFSTCLCNPGFHANQNGTACHPCEPHRYKSEYGNPLECRECPENSDTLVTGAARCPCRQGYFRNADQEPESMPCATSPSAPRDISFETEFTSVVLKWSPPEFNGGRDVIWYRVECAQCGDHYFVEDNIRMPVLTISRLRPGTTYDVMIFSLNSVSKYFNQRNYTQIQVKTRDAIMPEDVTMANTAPGEVHLFWRRPDNFYGRTFCVRITAPGLADPTEPRCVNGTELILANLVPGNYAFEVGAVVSPDLPIIYSKKQFVQVTEGQLVEVTQKQLILVVGMMSVICFLFILLCSCAVFMYRRQNAAAINNCKQLSPCGGYGNGAPTLLTAYPSTHISGASPTNNTMMFNPPDGTLIDGRMVPIGQAFIEPAFYEDIKQMVSEFCQFLDPCELQIQNRYPKEFLSTYGETSVGFIDTSFSKHSYQNTMLSSGGAFGQPDSSAKIPVFIKSMSVSQAELRRFAIEASTMSQFRHPNVQLIYGISCMDSTWNLMTEMCEVGNLALYMGAAFTQSNSSSSGGEGSDESGENGGDNCGGIPTGQSKEMLAQFVHFLRGISCGMQYLSDVGYVHKVLTSANVRLNSNLVCKISGFDHRVTLDECPSMSQEWLQLMDFLTPWCAPEVLQSGKYSSSSDVWSFAVIAWELMNCMTLSINNTTSPTSNNSTPNSYNKPTANQNDALNTSFNNGTSSFTAVQNNTSPARTVNNRSNSPSGVARPNNSANPTSTFGSDSSSDHIYSTAHPNAPSLNSEHGEQTSTGGTSDRRQTSSPISTTENISVLVPYADMTQQRICEYLTSGQRLPIPGRTPQTLGTLINDCWTPDRTSRPLFSQLRETLETFMRQPRLWDVPFDSSISSPGRLKGGKSGVQGSIYAEAVAALGDEKNPTSGFSNYPSSYIGTLPRPLDSALLMSVDQWLMQHKLFAYRNAFASNQIYELQDLLSLEANQLKKIGVDSKKDRKAIMNSIQLLKDRILAAPGDIYGPIEANETPLGHANQQPNARLTFTSPVHSII